MHDGLGLVGDLGGFRGVGIVEGTLDQRLLPPIEVKDRLLPDHDLQESSGPEVRVGGAEEVASTLLQAEAGHVDVVVREIPQEQLEIQKTYILYNVYICIYIYTGH